MDRERWETIERLYADALERPADDRPAFLDEACRGNAELRREIAELVAEYEKDPGFLEAPLVDVASGSQRGSTGEATTYVGPYRLVRMLGRGGMGEVYLAVHEVEDFEHTVAVKVVRRGMDTEDVLARFKLERRILASLKHPHIAGLLDGGVTDDGRPYFVMEFVEGTQLDEYCDRNRLGVRARLELFGIVCAAVQHAHQNLVVHRDLKPSNILVGRDGAPKLLDFGIGKLLDPEGTGTTNLTGTHMRVLTPDYASPEQVAGEPITTASDVYSLGVLLYGLMSGRHPLAGADRSPPSLEAAVLGQEPEPPSRAVTAAVTFSESDDTASQTSVAELRSTDPARLRRELAGDLDNIVLKALRKEPERRYASAAALAEDIERHLAGRPIHARPDTLGYRTAKFVRRNRGAVAAAGVILLLLIGSTITTQIQNQRIWAESERVARERDKALEVQGYLLEMFGAVGPEGTDQDEVSARELLDAQAAAIEHQYQGDPELQAEMQHVVADGYQRLAEFEKAEGLARTSLAARVRLFGDVHPDVARTLNLLGWIRREQGDQDEAERHLRASVDTWRRLGDLDPLAFSRALNDLGITRQDFGDFDEAEALLGQALDIRMREVGESHRSVGITANNLMVLLANQSRFDESIEMASLARRSLETALGPDHARVWVVRGNQAALNQLAGRWDEAATEYRALLDRSIERFGPEHPEVATASVRVAGVLLQGPDSGPEQIVEAERVARSALAIRETHYGSSHPAVAESAEQVTDALLARGEFESALPIQRRALAVKRELGGPSHPSVGASLRRLGRIHRGLGQIARADSLQEAALTVFLDTYGPQSRFTAAQQAIVGRNLVERGAQTEGLALLEEAHAVVVELLPPEHPALHSFRIPLAEADVIVGNYARADSLTTLIENDLESLRPADRVRVDEIRRKLTERANTGS